MLASQLLRGPGPVVSPPPAPPVAAVVPVMAQVSPLRHRSGTDLSMAQLEGLRQAHRTDTERAVRSATEELSAYSVLVEERKRRLGESNEHASLALLAAQHEAKVSSLALQHTQELDKVRRAADDAAREMQLAMRTMQQHHETAASTIEARHKQDIQHLVAKSEEHIQAQMAAQHEAHTITMATFSEKHEHSLRDLELRCEQKVESMRLNLGAAVGKERDEAQALIKRLEGSHDVDLRQLQERERQQRLAEIQSATDKVHAGEAKNLQLQMQVVDLNSKLDIAQAQLHSAVEQAKQSREGMEHNVRSLVKGIEDERAARQEAEERLHHTMDDAQARGAAETERHRVEMSTTVELHNQQVTLLQTELQKLSDSEHTRVVASNAQSRQLEKDVAEFKEKLQAQLQEQLEMINLQHAQEMKDLQSELLQSAREQNEQNVLAVDNAYIEKISTLERGKQAELQSMESAYGDTNRILEHEVQTLRQELKAQRELSDMEQKTAVTMLKDKHSSAVRDSEREMQSKMQDLAMETDAMLRKQERDAALTLEREKLAVATQCREFAAQLQERDKQYQEKLQHEIEELKQQMAEASTRTADEHKLAETRQAKLRDDFQEQLRAKDETHITQLRAVEMENARLHLEVEERLNAASEKYNQHLFGMDSENRRIYDLAEVRVQELMAQHKQQAESLKEQHDGAVQSSVQEQEKVKQQMEATRQRVETILATNEKLEEEVLALRRKEETRVAGEDDSEKVISLLKLEKESLIAEREAAIAELNVKMQQQLRASEDERLTMMQQLDTARKQSMLTITAASDAATLDHQLRDAHTALLQKDAEHQVVVRALHDQLALADVDVSKLRAELDHVPHVKTPHPDILEAEMERADTHAAQRILDAEQQLAAEKARMQEHYLQQLAEAERLAQQQLGNVGEKFTAQMTHLQQMVSSLQGRLMDKDGQAKRVDMELRRAQKAIAEITLIYQAREKDFVSEAHRMQITQLGLNDGMKQLQLEKQLQMNQDEQKLMVLQSQVQQALTAMQQVVGSSAEAALSPKAQQQQQQQQQQQGLVAFPSTKAMSTPSRSVPVQNVPMQSTMQSMPQSMSMPTQSHLRSTSLATHNSTKPNNILAQHAFSQELAKRNAAAAKQSHLVSAPTGGGSLLKSSPFGMQSVGNKMTLTSDQLASL